MSKRRRLSIGLWSNMGMAYRVDTLSTSRRIFSFLSLFRILHSQFPLIVTLNSGSCDPFPSKSALASAPQRGNLVHLSSPHAARFYLQPHHQTLNRLCFEDPDIYQFAQHFDSAD